MAENKKIIQYIADKRRKNGDEMSIYYKVFYKACGSICYRIS